MKRINKNQKNWKVRRIFSKKAQEEMVGFAIIIILVMVILLIFLALSMTKSRKQSVESYEARDFIQASLQVSTSCQDYFENNISVKKLIFKCINKQKCENNLDSCYILNKTMKEILENSFSVSKESPIKAYELNITSQEKEILSLKKGNITKEYKSSVQEFQKSGNNVKIKFSLYF